LPFAKALYDLRAKKAKDYNDKQELELRLVPASAVLARVELRSDAKANLAPATNEPTTRTNSRQQRRAIGCMQGALEL